MFGIVARTILSPVLILLVPIPALAQAAPPRPAAPAPAPVSAQPQATTAAYGDWVVRCVMAGEAPQAKRLCEALQTIQVQVQGQQAPIAQIAFGRIEAKDPLRVTLVLPNNVQLADGPQIALSATDSQTAKLTWKRCLPSGCFADAEAKPEFLQRWRAASENGQIQFRDGAGQRVALPISFKGLQQAIDALPKG